MKLRKLAICFFGTVALWAGTIRAEVLTLPPDQWPEWAHRDGIVMAGSWEPLLFRIRRDGANRYTPTPEQQAAWDREHSPEMIDRLKSLGVNFVMMHCYKGAGLAAERQSMADAVKFTRLCHEAGLKVGVYNYSGAFLWELFFKEVPEAKEWVLLDEAGKPVTYTPTNTYRYAWNRHHPQAVAFYRNLVKFAVQDVQADLIHFDNYQYGAGFDQQSVKDFHLYLQGTFSPEQLKQAGIDADSVLPPKRADPPSLLKFAWRDFQCTYQGSSYEAMTRYARSLRKDILLNCNPMSVPRYTWPPVDHARMLTGGEAFWDESWPSGLKDGKPQTRIRSYKVGRLMDNMVFSYIITPVDAAEAIAFNHPDCLGCVCWFEYANIVNRPGSKEPVSSALQPYIRFFHTRRDLLRGAEVIADVAILRSFPSQLFADPKYREMTASVEDDLISQRLPFQIIYDQQLPDLKRWPVLVLAGCVAMSDAQINAVTAFVRNGGKLCIVGEAATHDEWMKPRSRTVFADLPPAAIAHVEKPADAIAAVRKLAGDTLSLTVNCDAPVCAELTSQPDRRLVHLVNYDPAHPVERVAVRVQVPKGRKPKVILVADPDQNHDTEVPFEQVNDTVRFIVPKLSVYAVAAVQLH